MRAMGRSESLEIRDRFPHGMRVRAIRRATGRDRKTIREIATAAAPRFLDPYTEYIRQRTQEGCGNRAVVFDAMRARGPLRDAGGTPGAVRLGGLWRDGGPRRHRPQSLGVRVHPELLAVLVRGVCPGHPLLTCLEHAFAHFGGVPEEILSDHRRPRVWPHPRGGPVPGHPRFLACAPFQGFVPKAAEAYRAQTKGHGERPIQSLRGDFWPRVRTVGVTRPGIAPGATPTETGVS